MSDEPLLRVVHGAPTPEETAALVAVVLARALAAQGPAADGGEVRSPWCDPRRGLRRSLAHGPGGWRASALPR